jgi:Tfp pilus assembly protein PilO
LATINEAARDRDIVLLAIKPQAAKTHEKHVELPIQLEVSGGYHALGHFINRLETAATVIKLVRLKINAPEMTSTELKAQMTVVVLYLKAIS